MSLPFLSLTHRLVRDAPYEMNWALMPGAEMVYRPSAAGAGIWPRTKSAKAAIKTAVFILVQSLHTNKERIPRIDTVTNASRLLKRRKPNSPPPLPGLVTLLI